MGILLDKTLERLAVVFKAAAEEPKPVIEAAGWEGLKPEYLSEAWIWINGPWRAEPTREAWLRFHLQHLWKVKGIRGWQCPERG